MSDPYWRKFNQALARYLDERLNIPPSQAPLSEDDPDPQLLQSLIERGRPE